MYKVVIDNSELIRRELLAKAREKAYKIILDGKRKKEKIIEFYRKKAEEKAREILKRAELEAKWIKNRIIAQALLKIREERIKRKWLLAKSK